MNNVISQLHRGLKLRYFLTVIATMVLSISTFLQPVLQSVRQGSYLYQGYHNDLVNLAFSSDILSSFVPVLGAIPLAAGYLDDLKSKFVRFCLIRGSYSSYLLFQCFACWLCGSAVLLGGVATWGLTSLVFVPMEQVMETYTSVSPQIIAKLVLLFVNSGLWAVVGMALSTVMESKYIAYISPFIVYYLLVILYERYFPSAWLLYPRNWLDPKIWPYGVGSAVVFLLELTFFSGLLFYFRGKRRLESL